VNAAPAVTRPPRSETIFVGAKVAFTVAATGKLPLSYQWRKDGINLPGATAALLELDNVQPSDAGQYAVSVNNDLGSVLSAEAALRVTSHTFVLPTPGTVVSLGGPMVPLGLTNAVAIAAGSLHSLALRGDGTVVEWRQPLHPEEPISLVPTGLSNVIAIAAGMNQSLALHSDGTVIGWPNSSAPTDLFGVIAIAAGFEQNIAVKVDGTVVTWGSSPGAPEGLSNVGAVAAGRGGSIALKNDGSAVLWGGSVARINPNVFAGLNDLVAVAHFRM
jgi:hypothetical protein